MRVIRNVHVTPISLEKREPVALTIGNFDGFHRGHQVLLEQVLREAGTLGIRPALMSFSPSPAQFFSKENARPVIMPWRDRLAYLRASGIEDIHILRFDQKLASVTAEDFLQHIVKERIGAKYIVIGDDFHFGYRRQGTPEWLVKHAPMQGIGVLCVPAQLENGRRISSSWIRELLAQGDVQQAQSLLGRPYSVTSHVRYGHQRGRLWGFPTANLIPAKEPLVRGVYRVWVKIPGLNELVAGITNVGNRPSLEEVNPPVSVEVHLLEGQDWNIYSQRIKVYFIEKCRAERRFESFDALRQQIALDVTWAKSRFATEKKPEIAF